MDEQHSDNIHSFLSSKNPAKILKQLDAKQIKTLFAKLRQHNDHLTQLARLDSLTQLPNRFYFELSAKRLLAQANRHENKVAILSLDLDGFKEVNDQYGHAVGDKVLQSVAASLHNVTRQEDLVARIGGDEFIVILPCISQYADAGGVAIKIINCISKIKIDGCRGMNLNCCVGIAGYPIAATSIDDLLLCADKALYIAKNKGAGHLEYFTKKAKQEYRYAQKLLKTLQQNLAQDTLALSYLPIYKNRESMVAGVQVRLPGMQEVALHLQGNKEFYAKLSVGYIRKAYANYCRWKEHDINITNLLLVLDVDQNMLFENSFRQALQALFKEDVSFKDDCVLRVVGLNGSLFSEELFEFYINIGVKFCFTYNENQQTNVMRLRDFEPKYIDINLNIVCPEKDASKCNQGFLKALTSFVQSIGAQVILSDIETDDNQKYADHSGADYICGSKFSARLSSKEVIAYLTRHFCHHS
jgi:diguanylate cyclase (GGDEF)-like protein